MSASSTVNEAYARSLIGWPVAVITLSGEEHVGVLSRIQDGKLVLNDSKGTQSGSAHSDVNAKVAGSRKAAAGGASRKTKKVPSAPLLSTPFPQPSFGPKLIVPLPNVSFMMPLIP